MSGGRTVLATDNRMLMWSGRHGNLDGGIRFRKGWEVVLEECAVIVVQLPVSRSSSFPSQSRTRLTSSRDCYPPSRSS